MEREDVAASTPRYRAFLSYSHADNVAAARLHRQLEGYRLPRGLAAAADARRIGPIFRDRDELAASPDLTATVKDALARSDTLVVLCSPDARRSPWVAREIALFAELHPDAPIFAALLRGKPAESFPDALLRTGEPLAADLRPEGDGQKLGRLKLVAGIAGISLDALVQRDAQRRLRAVTAITVLAIAIALAMGAMTMIAFQARNEAERQRAAAEGLIEYMLTDLRDGLRSVGRLDVMTNVNERAMQYYAAQGDLSELPAESLERRARVIGEIGEDDENRGDLAAAEARYQELYRTTAALLENDPGDQRRMFAHALSENRLALLAYARERTAPALAGWHRTDALLGKTVAWGRERTEWLRLSAYVNGNICAATLKLGQDPEQALSHCRNAVHFNERLVTMRPGDDSAKYDLAFHTLWLAEALIAAGDDDEIGHAQDRYLGLVDELVTKQPENMLWREQQMEIYVRHADLLRQSDRRAEAQDFIDRARRIDDMLIARDPDNAVWRKYEMRLAQNQGGAPR